MLEFFGHPFSSYCQKALIAFYERDVAFTPHLVDLADADHRAAFEAVWPVRKFPLLVDDDAGRTIPESSIIIEYLDSARPGLAPMVPVDREAALEVRLWDRLFDNYVAIPMQRIVAERIRGDDAKDPHGEAEARVMLATAYRTLETRLAGRTWAVGDIFTLADCAAAPALFYGERALSFRASHPRLWAYFERLRTRPSYARALAEAEPFFEFFPRREGDAGLSR